MNIRRAQREDLPQILQLQFEAYQSEAVLLGDPNIPPLTQTLDDLEREFCDGIFLKAVDDQGAIIGSVRAYAKEGAAYIGKLIVKPHLQGQGIGTSLLNAIEQAFPAHRYELFTSSKSVRNIRLYERHGYVRFKELAVKPGLSMVFLEKSVL